MVSRGQGSASAEGHEPGRQLARVGHPQAVVGAGVEGRGHRVGLGAHSGHDQTDGGVQLAMGIDQPRGGRCQHSDDVVGGWEGDHMETGTERVLEDIGDLARSLVQDHGDTTLGCLGFGLLVADAHGARIVGPACGW